MSRSWPPSNHTSMSPSSSSARSAPMQRILLVVPPTNHKDLVQIYKGKMAARTPLRLHSNRQRRRREIQGAPAKQWAKESSRRKVLQVSSRFFCCSTPWKLAAQGCLTSCGDVSGVPYPFGIGAGCYHSPGFNLTCDKTRNTPNQLLGDDAPPASAASTSSPSTASAAPPTDTPRGEASAATAGRTRCRTEATSW